MTRNQRDQIVESIAWDIKDRFANTTSADVEEADFVLGDRNLSKKLVALTDEDKQALFYEVLVTLTLASLTGNSVL